MCGMSTSFVAKKKEDSTVSNKRTGMNHRILRKNLDQGSVVVFDQ